MGRNIAGIDLILDSNTGRQVFLEINSIPQLTTGAFIQEKTQAVLTALINSFKE
jgi:D-alanine-D-alanine ligase-like ATP-grasp enzyme